ncbi:GntR family transcriptional regulator [Deinococcus hopiensis]|uniref:GntR family transcriptional regulator n=1 Tax=Deinococcus hopiensis KR-140 TaxID=695939 RepID=A0A1W1VSK2_9DEIO|nr:GntR family transcriptional regulator [Deinococcus hopiensis]SMB96253.1 GntR family transcriptional regulator [Deinococcus hopiensis KR-140]
MERSDGQAALLREWTETLDLTRNVPLYLQLQEAIGQTISRGQLRPGQALPPVRTLAAGLNLAPGTVSRVYAALGRAGLTENRAGAGTVVAAGAWQGRLEQEAGLRELRTLLEQLLAAGLGSAQLREVVEDVLTGSSSPL